MLFKKITAAALSLTMVCGIAPSIPGGADLSLQAASADPGDITGKTFFYDSTNKYLTLYYNVDPDEIIDFSMKEEVKYINTYPGVVLPESCAELFKGYTNCTTVDIRDADVSNVTNMSGMFDGCTNLTSVRFGSSEFANVTQVQNMFRNCTSLRSVDLGFLKKSRITNFKSMFEGCTKLESADLSCIDTSRAATFSSMFSACKSLATVDLTGIDTSNVTDMSNMFSFCAVLGSLDLSGFNTEKVTSMIGMFQGCNNLKELDLRSFSSASLTNMNYMFCNCYQLSSIRFNTTRFNASKVTEMNSTFAACGLKQFSFYGMNTESLVSCRTMFYGCGELRSLMLNGLNMKKVMYCENMFTACDALTRIALDENFTDVTAEMQLTNGKYGWIVTDEPDTVISGNGTYAVISNTELTNYTRITDEPVPFSFFSLKGLKYPAPGTKPDLSGLEPVDISDYNVTDYYTIDKENTCWIDARTDTAVGENDVFKFGVPYILRVRLIPEDHKYFDSNSTKSVDTNTKIFGMDGKTEYCAAYPGTGMLWEEDDSLCFYCTLTNYCQTTSPAVYTCGINKDSDGEYINGVSVKVNKLYPLTVTSAKPGVINISTKYSDSTIQSKTEAPSYEFSVDKKKWYTMADVKTSGITGLAHNTQYTLYVRTSGETQPFANTKITTAFLPGDVNSDGQFSVADALLLQKWIASAPGTTLANWKAADLCSNEVIDVFDLCMIKQMLVK